MKYLLVIYALFILAFDFFGESTQGWNIAYFTVQYLFAGLVATFCLFDTVTSKVPYMLTAAFFFVLALFEVSMIRFDQSEYFFQVSEPKPLLSCGIVFISISVILIILKKL